jgi:hypothetical protein
MPGFPLDGRLAQCTICCSVTAATRLRQGSRAAGEDRGVSRGVLRPSPRAFDGPPPPRLDDAECLSALTFGLLQEIDKLEPWLG